MTKGYIAALWFLAKVLGALLAVTLAAGAFSWLGLDVLAMILGYAALCLMAVFLVGWLNAFRVLLFPKRPGDSID